MNIGPAEILVILFVALIVFGRRSYLPPALALPYVRGAR